MYYTELERLQAIADELQEELDIALQTDEQTVCVEHNVDCKEDYIEVLKDELSCVLRQISEEEQDMYYDTECELEEERLQLCLSQGLSRYC